MRAHGEDPDEIRRRGVAFVRKLRGTSRLEAARKERLEQERSTEALRDKFKRRVREKGSSVRELLRELSAKQGAELSLSYRKIESLDDEDALDALSDAEVLRLWEEMND